jgi:hypothetical protein
MGSAYAASDLLRSCSCRAAGCTPCGSVARSSGFEDPRDLQSLDVVAVDLIERAVAPSIVGAMILRPIVRILHAGRGTSDRDALTHKHTREHQRPCQPLSQRRSHLGLFGSGSCRRTLPSSAMRVWRAQQQANSLLSLQGGAIGRTGTGSDGESPLSNSTPAPRRLLNQAGGVLSLACHLSGGHKSCLRFCVS